MRPAPSASRYSWRSRYGRAPSSRAPSCTPRWKGRCWNACSVLWWMKTPIGPWSGRMPCARATARATGSVASGAGACAMSVRRRRRGRLGGAEQPEGAPAGARVLLDLVQQRDDVVVDVPGARRVDGDRAVGREPVQRLVDARLVQERHLLGEREPDVVVVRRLLHLVRVRVAV